MTRERPSVAAALRAWAEDLEAFGIEEVASAEAAPLPSAAARPAAEPRAREAPAPMPATEAPSGESAALRRLEQLAAEIAECQRCDLCRTRTRTVPGQGSEAAELMFVGEAPGADEDRQGLAFVGRAGQLLTRMIGAMGFERDEVFIANVLKCRPPGNRDPRPEEMMRCRPFLEAQIEAVAPRVIVALGGFAARNLLGVDATVSVGRMRGRAHDALGRKVIVTYHPAYLLRSPQMKRGAWADLQLALKLLGRQPPSRSA